MLGLASVLLLGVGAQWLAWRLKLPSILVLLFVGFAAGPWSGWLSPDELLGDSLLPFVSLAVAVILLEGGLTLRFSELRGVGGAVRNLVLIGIPVAWTGGTLAAHYVLGFDWRLALLLGAVLTVTGPTVIIPLLRHVRPNASVGAVVRWEGIVNDPFGAILAVLVFQVMLVADARDAGTLAAVAGLTGLAAGAAAGGLGALVLLALLSRQRLPDFLHSSMTLAVGLGAFVAADAVQHESGLLAVTLMGIVLANQSVVSVDHIVEFKENLRVLLISCLFILLAARLPLEEFQRIGWREFGFVAALILVVRPVTVLCATLFTGLSWRERIFVAWMAPRGIVAAAICSVFALELGREGVPGAERLTTAGFSVIVGTVAVYGLTAAPLARRLGVAVGASGVLIVGANRFARAIAKALEDVGVHALLVDRNRRLVRTARMEGRNALLGDILSEDLMARAPLDGIGKVLCVLPNDEINALACLHLIEVVGRSEVYQLAESASHGEEERLPRHLRGRTLFADDASFDALAEAFRAGASVKATRLGAEFDFGDFRAIHGGETATVIPLFTLTDDGDLDVWTAERSDEPGRDLTLIAVVPHES